MLTLCLCSGRSKGQEVAVVLVASCHFVNCYGHTQPNTKDDPQLNVTFYKQLTAAVSVPVGLISYLVPTRGLSNLSLSNL